MIKGGIYQYYVEGEDEKKLLEVLKRDLGCIVSGKVEKFNVIQNRFTVARVRPLKTGTTVVLIYDTDVDNTEIMKQNVEFLKRQSAIKAVLCIPQVKNLEEELGRACQVKSALEVTSSPTLTDFKRDFISCNNLATKLKKCNFDIAKLWSRVPNNSFGEFGNDADKIKL